MKTHASAKYDIDEVVVECNETEVCVGLERSAQSLVGKEINPDQIKEKVQFLLNDNRISKLSYKLATLKVRNILTLNIETKLKISRIEHESNLKIPFEKMKSFLSIKEGTYLNERDLKKSKELLKKQLKDKGFGDISLVFNLKKKKKSIDIKVMIKIGKIIKLKYFQIINEKGDDLDHSYGKRFNSFINESWDMVRFKVAVDELSQDLLKEGYFFSKVKFNNITNERNEVSVSLVVIRGPRINFSFRGNHVFSRHELLRPLIVTLKNSIGAISHNEIKKIIDEEYRKKGIYNTHINLRLQIGLLSKDVKYRNYFISIAEGKKIPVSEVIYKGNIEKKVSDLKDLYYEKSSVLASRDFLDESFINEFPKFLKRFYLEHGFVSVEIEKPIIRINQNFKSSTIIFKISERQKTTVEKIVFEGVPEELAIQMRKMMMNKVNKPLNIVNLSSDLEKILKHVRNQGYFYAQILNLNQIKLVQYSANKKRAFLNIKFNLEKKTIFEEVLITGNVKTKKEVINNEIRIRKNDIITPEKLEKIKKDLSSLGLFSLIRVSPYLLSSKQKASHYYTNILIQVREKEFGNGEFAPGYRTDLGAKVSVSINYNNIFGLNHSHSLKIQANQRLNTSTIDSKRRDLYKKELEYLLRWNYNWPYFLGTKMDFDFSSRAQRRRYFGFDADIVRVAPGLFRKIGDHVRVGLRYQFETISQFNASADKDSDFFRIGSLSPSINIDLRDNAINPRSGAFFSLSAEFANPSLFSLKDEDIEVNYLKLVSRNKFYYSVNRWTFALSVTMGVEKNNATERKYDSLGNPIFNPSGEYSTLGFIPSIKVFRLDGVDTVRGFSDSEINIVEDAQVDIGEIIIQDEAYLVNFKFEPRYLVSDTFMCGLFLDAGRIFVNSFKPLNLRVSSGITLKFLTPVGSLDFDFGVKLKRGIRPDLSKESFGRFHLSIGLF